MSILPIKEYSKGKSNRREISIPKEELEYFKEEKNTVKKFKKQFNHENNDKIVTYVKILKIGKYEDLQREIKELKLKESDYKSVEKQKLEIANLNQELSDFTTQIEIKDNEISNLNESIKILEESLKENAPTEEEVSRLTKENTELITSKKRLKSQNKKLNDQLQNQKNENIKLSSDLKNIDENHDNILRNTKNLYQKQYEQLEERYDKLNEEKEKYSNLIASLLKDFKEILQYSFFDLFRNKYKPKIRGSIKEIESVKQISSKSYEIDMKETEK